MSHMQRCEEPYMAHERQFGHAWCIGTLFHASLKVHIHGTVCSFHMYDSSDVVETVTSETETWLKFRDETETKTLS